MQRCTAYWPGALLVAFICIIFAPPNGTEYFFYDDPALIADVPQVQGGVSPENAIWALKSLDHNNWTPLARWSHQLDASLFGQNVAAARWVSVLLHAVNALLVCALLRRFGVHSVWAAGLALAWALHPLHVETVAWLSNRKHLLAATAALGATLCWWPPAQLERPGNAAWRRPIATLLFALSLMARPTALLLPVIWLAGDRWKFRRAENWKLSGICMLFPILLSAFCAALTICAQDGRRADWIIAPSLADGLWIAPLGASHLTIRTLLPWNLAFHYPVPLHPAWWAVALGVTLLAAAAILMWRLRKRHPLAAMGLLLALATWIPSSGLVPMGDLLTADRFAYLPLLGLVMTLAAIRLPIFKPVLRRLFMVAMLLAWAVLSKLQTATWKDSSTIFAQARRATPKNPFVCIQWGMWEVEKRNLPAACEQLEGALRLDEGSLIARYNLAVTQLHLGLPQLAADNLRIFLSKQDDSPEVHWLLSLAQFQNADLGAALKEARQVLLLQPDHPLARQRVMEIESILKPKAQLRRQTPIPPTQ